MLSHLLNKECVFYIVSCCCCYYNCHVLLYIAYPTKQCICLVSLQVLIFFLKVLLHGSYFSVYTILSNNYITTS